LEKKEKSKFRYWASPSLLGPRPKPARPVSASSPPARPRARAPAHGVVAPRQRSAAACPYAVEPSDTRPVAPATSALAYSPSARSSASLLPPFSPAAAAAELRLRHCRLPSSATALASAPAHRIRLRLRHRRASSSRTRCSPRPALIRPPPAVMPRRSSGQAHRSDPLRGPHPSAPFLALFSSARAPRLHRESHRPHRTAYLGRSWPADGVPCRRAAMLAGELYAELVWPPTRYH
jgi:hypothetical protein